MQRIRINRRVVIEALFILLIGVVILVDQLTKKHFATAIHEKQTQTVIEGFFYFTHYRNRGSAWSFMSDVWWAQIFFKVLTVVALIAFIFLYIYTLKKDYKWLKVALVFVIGGTIGNFIDRLLFNEVIDFIGFIFWGYYFPVFNLADSFLVVGTIMIIIHLLFIDKDAVFKKNDAKKEDSSN